MVECMKTTSCFFLLLFCWSTMAGAVTMADLFASLERQPLTELDRFQTKSVELRTQSVRDRFSPNLTGILASEAYNSPTNLRPVSPTEAPRLLAKNEPLPFSETISRVGAQLSLPIFIKELFSLGNQAASLAESSRMNKRLKLLEHQAVLVTADAHLTHMSSLIRALIRSISPGTRPDNSKAAYSKLLSHSLEFSLQSRFG